MSKARSPYGDGKSAGRIADILAAACLPAVSAAQAAGDGKALYLEHCAGCRGKNGIGKARRAEG
jgi:mono/diheme cytochrome c family protein